MATRASVLRPLAAGSSALLVDCILLTFARVLMIQSAVCACARAARHQQRRGVYLCLQGLD